MNLTPEYKKYIEDARAKGMTDIQIRGALMAAGWTDIQVRDLFDAFKNAEQPAQPKSYDFNMPIASATIVRNDVQQKPLEQKPIVQTVVNASPITPQVEPQPLRPHIAQPAYVPPQRTAPIIQSTGAQPIASVQSTTAESRAYITSEFKPDPIVGARSNQGMSTDNTQGMVANPSRSGVSVYQGGDSFSRPVANQTFSPQTAYRGANNQATTNTAGVAQSVIIKESSSSLKKVFASVLIIAFFLSSSVYAYMQFVDPFLFKTDEQVLLESLATMSSYSGYISIENNVTMSTGGAQVAFDADVEYGGEDNPGRWSLHIHDVTINGPDEVFEQTIFSVVLKSILSTIDVTVRYIDGSMYLYPGGLTALLGPDAQEALFEKWIAFTPDEIGGAILSQTTGTSAEVEFNSIFSEIPTTIRDIDYTISDSYVRDLQQHITISITQSALAEYLRSTLEQDILVEDVPALEISFVINKDKWLDRLETKTTLGEDSSTMISVISPGNVDSAILPPTSIIQIEDIMSFISGGLMVGTIDYPQGPIENALVSVREEIFMQYESSYEKVCTANNKINTEKALAGELMQTRVTALTDIQGMKTKGDQSAISCYSSPDAFVIGAVVEGKTACVDFQGKIGSDDEYVIDTVKKECVVPQVE